MSWSKLQQDHSTLELLLGLKQGRKTTCWAAFCSVKPNRISKKTSIAFMMIFNLSWCSQYKSNLAIQFSLADSCYTSTSFSVYLTVLWPYKEKTPDLTNSDQFWKWKKTSDAICFCCNTYLTNGLQFPGIFLLCVCVWPLMCMFLLWLAVIHTLLLGYSFQGFSFVCVPVDTS